MPVTRYPAGNSLLTPNSAILLGIPIYRSYGVMMDDREIVELEHRLTELRTKHRNLDDAIEALISAGSWDQLQLKRLKKQKLVLKDDITRLENTLMPDIIA